MWIIGSIHKKTGNFSVAEKPAIHTKFSKAEKEAERLAGNHADKHFIVMELSSMFQSTVTVNKVDVNSVIN